MDKNIKFQSAKILNRQIDELIGVCRGLIADDILNQTEIEYMQKWITANTAVIDNPVFMPIADLIEEILEDGHVDEDEAAELLEALTEFTANDFELGEVLKPTTLPLCVPAPTIDFDESSFALTGTFNFGNRKSVTKAIEETGGTVKSTLTMSTDFLIIGSYATDSWKHSTYGRKIEKAAKWRDEMCGLQIISEDHWRKQMSKQ